MLNLCYLQTGTIPEGLFQMLGGVNDFLNLMGNDLSCCMYNYSGHRLVGLYYVHSYEVGIESGGWLPPGTGASMHRPHYYRPA